MSRCATWSFLNLWGNIVRLDTKFPLKFIHFLISMLFLRGGLL